MSDGQPIGKFQVLRTLGAGAHSTILHIQRLSDGRPYALKVVPIDGPDDFKYLEQARHEYRVGRMLDHPNLARVVALETQADWFRRVRKVHLLLEYVEGLTLDQLPPVPPVQLLPLFVQAAAGLVHMHRRGVFHADIKPHNLMRTTEGRLKIIDFGLAWVKGEPKGRVQGTPEYMAPETARRKIVNEHTDIFNFGATMYRLVTGRTVPPVLAIDGGKPLKAETWTGLLRPVAASNPQTPPELADLIHRCLSYNASDRPERMSVVQGTLDRLTDELAGQSADALGPAGGRTTG